MKTQTATLTADYVAVTVHDVTGIYKVSAATDDATQRSGTLVHTATGTADEFINGLVTMGANVERIATPYFLGPDGFDTEVDFAAPATTETVLVREIQRLKAAADRADHNDAMNGGWGNAGQRLRNKADAFSEALEIYRTHG